MSFTIVIPYYNGQQYLKRLLDTIPDAIPIIIVDDQSQQPPNNIERANVRVIRSETRGYFTGAVNRGIQACKTGVLILNQDTYFSSDKWLNFIEESKKRYGLFGERAGSHPAWPNRYIHGTFMYIRRDVIKAVGLMDEDNFPHWGSTCEYQLRACRRGFKALPVKNVPGFVHLRRGSFGSATKKALSSGEIKQSKLIRTPPNISVIITCYNYGRYLQDTVNSLIGGETSLGHTDGQTYQGFEIVIVDDGSIDDSAKIGKSLADPWKGIHFVSQENAGSAVAMNTGIETSHARGGHFIAPLDGDDMMKAQRLERFLKTYEANPHSVIYDNIRYFAYGQEGLVNWETGERFSSLDLGEYDFEEIVLKNKMHKGLFYPRQAWEEVGGYPEVMNRGREDWAFNIGLGLKGWCGINTGEFEYLYRREGQNRTLKNTTPRWRSKFLAQIRALYPDIYKGERPMGCCGSRKVAGSKVEVSAMKTKLDLPGKDGMVILEYVGGNAGDETWHGPVTNTIYVLGGIRKKGYVDAKDANGIPAKRIDGMLALKDKGKKVFKLVKVEERKPVEVKVPVVVAEFNTDDFTKLSINALKKELPSLPVSQIEAIMIAEKSGKNRINAIRALKKALDERNT